MALYDFLEVEGANGQVVPYLGYVATSVTFPKYFLGVPIEMSTLALVGPDVRSTSESLMLMGTNTLDVLYDLYCETSLTNHQPIPHGSAMVLKVLELGHKQSSTGQQGIVKIQAGLLRPYWQLWFRRVM